MRSLRMLVTVCALYCPSALAVDREFGDVVRVLSDEFRTRPMRIPLFGLVNMVTFVARPAGTSHIDLAVFENIKDQGRSGRDLDEVVRRAVGRSWAPFIQVHSRRNGKEEAVLVYMRGEGRNCRLLVTAIERDEATVVQLRLNPEGLQRWIAAPMRSALSNHNRSGNWGDE